MPNPPLHALFLIAGLALSACAGGPNHLETTAAAPNPADCPDVTRLRAPQLYGSWELTLLPDGPRGTLTLRRHPEFSESLRGLFDYGGHRSLASGDVEEGEFHLDESRDGKSLFAFWSGRLVPAACGAEIRGQWQPLAAPGQPPLPERGFVLRRPRAPAW